MTSQINNLGPTLPISQEIHQTKYRGEQETFYDSMMRQSSALGDSDDHRRAFSDIILNQRFMAAGRVQSAVGSPRQVTPWNCFVSGTIEDSFDSIMDRVKEAGETMRMGGGIGYDFSTLRPKGQRIKSLDSQSSGPVSFMDIFDATCGTISSSGHRRGAQMGVMRVDHPDIMEFIHAKRNSSKLTRFNISVGVTDEFMEAVKKGKQFNLKWKGRIQDTVDARALWDDIMRSTWDWAEPGVLFIDRINKENNLWYCEDIRATNPCVTGDTLVKTPEGDKCIDEIVKSFNEGTYQTVISYNTATGENEEREIYFGDLTRRDAEIIELETDDGKSVKLTPDHKVYTSNRGYVKAEELNEEDDLVTY